MPDEVLAQFWGAFFAAGFAIVTFAITRAFQSTYQRNRLHHNFLVKLEAKLNRHLAHVFSIVYIIEGVRQTTVNGNVSFNNLDAVMLEPVGDFHDLLDIDLINDVFSYNTGLEMLSSDLTNLSATYSEFRSALITKQMTMNEFKTILPNLPGDLKHLVRSWEEHLATTTDLLVQARIMIGRDKKKFLGLNWLFPRRLKPLTQKSIKTEKLKLLQEIEETRKQSEKRIKKINGMDR